MIRLLKCEYLKTRRRYLLLTVIAAMTVYFIWTFHGSYNAEGIRHGWALFLYQQPVVNTIFMPFFCIIIASRLSAIEHRGAMLKQLCTMTDKGRLYDAKLIYGMFLMSFCVAVSWIGAVLFRSFPSRSVWLVFYIYPADSTGNIHLAAFSCNHIQKSVCRLFCRYNGRVCGIVFIVSSEYRVVKKARALWTLRSA